YDEQNYKRSHLRNARKSSGRVTGRIAVMADTGAGSSASVNARRADQSRGSEPDRRKIFGATGSPGDTWIRRRWNSCRYRPERVSRRLGMGRISAEGRFLK